METICYIAGGASIAFGLITAILYQVNKPSEAFTTKMIASTLFIITGILALSQTLFSDEASSIIVIAMLLSQWGDYFLARKEMPKLSSKNSFMYGVFSFSASQILFVLGFLMYVDYEFCYYLLPLLLVGPLPLILGKCTKMLKLSTKDFWLSIVYSMLLCLTLVATANAYYQTSDDGMLIAMIGSIAFIISDFCLGLNYFSSFKHKKLFNFPIMIFYFGAEVLYAFSLFM